MGLPMNRAWFSLSCILVMLAATTAIVRPPFLRSLILPAVAEQLGIAITLNQARGHGLLEGLHLHRLTVASNQAPHDTFLSVGTLRVQSGHGMLWNPDTVVLEKAELVLRFGPDGTLLTNLPKLSGGSGSLRPIIEIRDASLKLLDHDRPPWLLQGIYGTMSPSGSHYHLKARVNDPELGVWHADAVLADSPSHLAVEVRSEGARLHMPSLKRLPFIPSSTWQHVELEGRAKAQLTLVTTLKTTITQLTLSDPNLILKVPIVGLSCHLKKGRALIEPKRIVLDQLAGVGWGGDICATKGTLEFFKNQSRFAFDLSGLNLDGRSILNPASGMDHFIPPGIKAGGKIHLEVHLEGKRHHFGGFGSGTIRSGLLLLPWSLSSQEGSLAWKGPWGLRRTPGSP